MPPIGNQPCTGKINKADVSGRIGSHELQDQVVNGGVFAMIFFVVNTAVEYPDTLLGILGKQCAFRPANKEIGIRLADIRSKNFLQHAYALLATIQSSA